MPEAKRYFPLFADLQNRLAVVVGSGKRAEKRVRQLSRYGADIVVISPDPTAALLDAQQDEVVTLETRDYVRGDLAGATIVMCVSDDPEVCAAVAGEAASLGCLVNVADSPTHSNFLLPSVMRRGAVEIAISTGGMAPPVAKALRKRLEDEVGDEWSAWVDLVHETLERSADWPEEARTRALTAVAHLSVLERLQSAQGPTVDEIIAEAEQAPEPAPEPEEAPEPEPATTPEEPSA